MRLRITKLFLTATLVMLVFPFFIRACNSSQHQRQSFHITWNVFIQDIDIAQKLAVVKIQLVVENFTCNASQLNIGIFQWAWYNETGYGYVWIQCYPCQSPEGHSSINCFNGTSENTLWSIQGKSELYPFDYYTIGFHIDGFHSNYIQDNQIFNITSFSATIDPHVYLNISNFELFRSTWETSNRGTSLPEVPIFEYLLQRKSSLPAIQLLLPLFLCYCLLGSSVFLNKKEKLNSRLTVYLGLFVLAPTFFFAIQSFIPPCRSSLSIPEFLLTNLMASTAIFAIGCMIPSASSRWSRSTFVDGLATGISMVIFFVLYTCFYLITPLHLEEVIEIAKIGVNTRLVLLFVLVLFEIGYSLSFLPIISRELNKRVRKFMAKSDIDKPKKEIRKDTALLKVQIYSEHCHTKFASMISFVLAFFVGVAVFLYTMYYQGIFPILLFWFSLLFMSGFTIVSILYILIDYGKDFKKISNMIEEIEQGKSLPPLKELAKKKKEKSENET